MNACIFAGPTLPPRDEARTLAAAWLPPARHGDVYRAVSLLRPQAIGIVDGYFQWTPSVWHKEILWALRQGVHVFGAASMGALRAAELSSFGMRGVGLIFEAYRDGVLVDCADGPFEDDDEVAVIHGPADSGYIAASEAMVNIRCTLVEAERSGVIAAGTRSRLIGIAKALYFPQRSYERMLEDARAAALPEGQLAALKGWLPAGRVNQKRADALAMLDAMQRFLAADPAPARASFRFEHTTLWDTAIAALQPAAAHDAEEAHALDEVQLDRARFRQLRREVLCSLLAPAGADTAGDRVSDRQPAAERRMEELARAEAARRAQDEIPAMLIERQMLARLRATGEYATVLARAQDKRARLDEQADLPRVDEFSGVQLLQLRDWYFSQTPGEDMPEDLEGYLRDAVYPDETRFHEAIFAEYVYRQIIAENTAADDRTPAGAWEDA